MPRGKVKVDQKSNVPEAERQSTLVLAHLGALEPVLDQLPAEMVLELDEAILKFQKRLGHVVQAKTVQKSCFRCDGTGQICDVCGESETACDCHESERTFSACEDCEGVGVVFVPRDA